MFSSMDEQTLRHPTLTVVIEVIAGLLVLTGVILFAVSKNGYRPEPSLSPTPDSVNLLPIDEVGRAISARSGNPAERLSDGNPFLGSSNPLEEAYVNPFE